MVFHLIEIESLLWASQRTAVDDRFTFTSYMLYEVIVSKAGPVLNTLLISAPELLALYLLYDWFRVLELWLENNLAIQTVLRISLLYAMLAEALGAFVAHNCRHYNDPYAYHALKLLHYVLLFERRLANRSVYVNLDLV